MPFKDYGSSLPPDAAAQLRVVNSNVNAKDMVAQYDLAFNGRTILAPKGVQQIGSFAFDYKGTDIVSMSNDVTDHWLEDNTAVQDHIGVKPAMVTISGFISELAISSSLLLSISTTLNAVQNGLTRVNNYTGNYTPGAVVSMQKAITQAQAVAVQIEQAVARAAQVAAFFQNGPVMSKQQAAYFQLSSLRLARIVFTVYTPFQVFYNMAITEMKATQSDKTKTMSDFTVTMKQLNFLGGESVSKYYADYGGRAAQSKQLKSFNGLTAGKGDLGLNAVNTAIKGSFAPLASA